jgi:trehalose-phosphatase
LPRLLRSTAELPPALGNAELRARLAGRSLAVFSDYDGTLTPIVARPELALLADETLALLNRLARHCLVAIISGRDLDDVRHMVRAEGVWYAGSHGMDLAAPDGARHEIEEAHRLLGVLAAAADALEAELTAVPGAWLDRKRFAVAAHTRQVDDARVPEVEAAVDDVVARYPELRRIDGKRVFEVRPDIEWDKGRALWWVFEQAGLGDTVVPIYLGDDLTDEDAFSALGDNGLGIVVTHGGARPSAADYSVTDTDDVRTFLTEVVTLLEETDA